MRVFIFLVSFLLSTSTFAKVIYVNNKATGANNGGSWINAYTVFETAITASSFGDSIWVAGGTYTPADYGSFYILPGRVYLGSFKGTESKANTRDLNDASSKTIIDGKNSQRHLWAKGSTDFGPANEAFIDGFTTQRGRAIINAYKDQDTDNGAAAIIRGGFVTFSNCSFLDNYTGQGGAICLFTYGTGGTTIGNTRISFKSCIFTNNQIGGSGVGNAISTETGADSNPLYEFIFDDCTFKDEPNVNIGSGSIVQLSSAKSSFTNCTFTNVTSTALQLDYGQTSLANCTFTNNNGYSTGCFDLGADGEITNCKFISCKNSYSNTVNAGPSVGYVRGKVKIDNCLFNNNRSNGSNGALVISGLGNVAMSGCSFTNNQTVYLTGRTSISQYGGAITVGNNAVLKASNCLFYNNSLDVNPAYYGWQKYGGAIYAGGSANVNLLHCTLVGNSATAGGAVYANLSVPANAVRITNSILWDNKVVIDTSSKPGTISRGTAINSLEREGYFPSKIIVSSSLVQAGTKCGSYCNATETISPIVSQDPLFVNMTGDFHLKVCSPARDAGNKDSVAALMTDKEGNSRLQGALPDLGIFEDISFSITAFSKNTPLGTALSFSAADFTSHYINPAGPLQKIKIVTLPSEGSLLFNGVKFKTPLIVSAADIPKLSFISDSCVAAQVQINWAGTSGDTCTFKNTSVVIISTGGGLYSRPAKPLITNLSPSADFCAGDSIKLQTASGHKRYLWSNGQTLANIIVRQSGKYTVQVYEHCYSPVSDTITAKLKPLPVLEINDGSRCLAGPAEVTAAGASTYSWYADSMSTTVLATGSKYKYLNLLADDTIYVSGKLNGCVSPRLAVITYIDNVPPKPIVGDSSHCVDKTAVLRLQNQDKNYVYAYYILNGENVKSIGFNSSSKYKLFKAGVNDTIVLVEARGIACISARDTVKLKALPLPPSPVISLSGSIKTCDSIRLSASTGYQLYEWYRFSDDSTIEIKSKSNELAIRHTDPTVNLSEEIIVFGYDHNGCMSEESEVLNLKIYTAAVPVISRDGDSLRASGQHKTYQWYYNGVEAGTTSNSIYADKNGSYTVTATDVNGCTSEESIPFDLNVTGVVDEEMETIVSVYPNPVKDLVTIKVSDAANIVLKSVYGTEVLNQNISESDTIDVSGLASGVYMAEVSCRGQLHTFKLVKE